MNRIIPAALVINDDVPQARVANALRGRAAPGDLGVRQQNGIGPVWQHDVQGAVAAVCHAVGDVQDGRAKAPQVHREDVQAPSSNYGTGNAASTLDHESIWLVAANQVLYPCEVNSTVQGAGVEPRDLPGVGVIRAIQNVGTPATVEVHLGVREGNAHLV